MSIVHKAVAAQGEGLEFVLSDETVDRVGDVIKADGWDLAWFKKNPIALFAHNGTFPIGKWENVRVQGGKLMGRLVLAARGTSERIDEIISLVEQNILRAVSVGFMPLEAEPIKGGGLRFMRSELREVSLVSVPANPSALAVAKSLNLSSETMSLCFGGQAIESPGNLAVTGKHAASTPAHVSKSRADLAALPKAKKMTTLSQRIENAQNDLVVKKDKLAELTAVDDIDADAVEELNSQIEGAERSLAALKSAEAKIGLSAAPAGSVASPAVNRRPLGFPQKEVKGFDLIVRAMVVRGCSHFGGKPIDKVLDERYPGHEATAIVAKADQTIGTTTGSHWADDLVRTAYGDFMQALTGYSVYPALRDRGVKLSFDGNGTVSIPGRTAGTAGGGFVAEGAPIRVGKVTTTGVTMTATKLGVIVAFSRELAKRSTPAIEGIVRQAILEDTSTILDAALLDATASSSSRPAGLLNGVSATATGFGGGDFDAIVADFKALLAPFIAADAADNITVIMNPAQGFAIDLMPDKMGQFGWASAITKRLNIIESTHATANRLIAIRNSDLATALGDAPEFDISEQATIHLEDTTPLEIVSGTPTVADPVRSLWQTATIGVRMLMDCSWKMRRSGMIAWIDGTSW